MLALHHRQGASSPLASRLRRSLIWCALVCWVLPVVIGEKALAASRISDLHGDEDLVFFPSVAHRVRDGRGWECEVRGCVYEPEKRSLIVGLLREALELKHLEMTDREAAIFAERSRLFMVDNERGRTIIVRIGEREHVLGKSGPDGLFSGVISLSDREIGMSGARTIQFQAVLPAGKETPRFTLTLRAAIRSRS